MLKKTTYLLHRISGTVISLLFLMWFITGLIIIYKSFPNVNKYTRFDKREAITDSLPNITDLLAKFPGERITHLQLTQHKGKSIFQVATPQKTHLVASNLQDADEYISPTELLRIANKWVDAPIQKIDTLEKRDIWVMYTKYLKELPLYKIHFADKEKHQLYISARTGEVQQFTNRNERFWAYIGAIPHKLYIPALRQHTRIWINTLTVLASISFIAVLTGIILGIRAFYKRYRIKKKLSCPYSKPGYKWHHILGMLFSVFLLTWSISGMMALQKVPQWLVPRHTDYKIPQKIKGSPIDPKDFPLDYRKLQAAYPHLKQVEWDYFQGIPIYKIIDGKKPLCIDASTNDIKPLSLTREDIARTIASIHGNDAKYTLEVIHEYEQYYMSRSGHLHLPVYKVSVDTPDNNIYYINPETAKYYHVDKNRKARRWLFNGFHYLHINWLVQRPLLWTFTIWFLALGCIAVSGTGVYLSFKYLFRTFKSKSKKTHKC